MDSSKAIEERAAAWLARRDCGDWSDRDDAELEQWLEASTANCLAFIRLEAAWQQSERLKALSTEPGVVPPRGQWQFSPFLNRPRATDGEPRRRTTFYAAAAASLLVLLGGVFFLTQDAFHGERYVTSIGGAAMLPMADGSRILLNTDSEIRVSLSKTERRVELEQGEAFFEVVPDPRRPFVVNAGDKRIVVLGTKFSVKRSGNDVRVVVTEGKVALDTDTIVGAGNVAEAKGRKLAVRERTLPEVEEILSWRSGYLVFHEISLAEAIAEFNRYNARRLVIEDPAVAAIRFSGKFRAENVEAFVRVLESGLPVRATMEQDRIVLDSLQHQ